MGPPAPGTGAPQPHHDDPAADHPPVSPEADSGVMTGAPAPDAGFAAPRSDEINSEDATAPLRWDEGPSPAQPGIDDTVYAPSLPGSDTGYPHPPWPDAGSPEPAPAGDAGLPPPPLAPAPGWDPGAAHAAPPPHQPPPSGSRQRPVLRNVALGAAAAILSVVVAGALVDSALGADRTARAASTWRPPTSAA